MSEMTSRIFYELLGDVKGIFICQGDRGNPRNAKETGRNTLFGMPALENLYLVPILIPLK